MIGSPVSQRLASFVEDGEIGIVGEDAVAPLAGEFAGDAGGDERVHGLRGGGDGHGFRAEAGAGFDRGEQFFIERQTEHKFITHVVPIG